MKVKDLCGVILDDVLLYYEFPREDGGVENVKLNIPCNSEELPFAYLDCEVISIFTLDTVDVIYVQVIPELPFSEEVDSDV